MDFIKFYYLNNYYIKYYIRQIQSDKIISLYILKQFGLHQF